jgi:hypothetical protein
MMKRKQIQLTARQAAALRREAARRGVSDAAVIRGLIDDLVVTAKPRSPDERWQRLERVIGKFHAREADIAREHDRYLAVDFDD